MLKVEEHFVWGLYPSHLTLAAFIDGYLDVIVYVKFECYCSMMSGNLINLGTSISKKEGFRILFLTSVITTYLFGYFSMLNLFYSLGNNKRFTYLIIMPFQIAAVLLLYFSSSNYDGWMRFTLLPLVYSYGLQNCWAQKHGYVPNMMTGNMQKVIDAIFKFICLKQSMTATDNGDTLLIILEIIGYFLGAVVAGFAQRYVISSTFGGPNGPLIIALILIPLKLLFSKTIEIPNPVRLYEGNTRHNESEAEIGDEFQWGIVVAIEEKTGS